MVNNKVMSKELKMVKKIFLLDNKKMQEKLLKMVFLLDNNKKMQEKLLLEKGKIKNHLPRFVIQPLIKMKQMFFADNFMV